MFGTFESSRSALLNNYGKSVALVVKRILDFVVALFLSLLVAPIALIVAVVILLTMGRPVLFKQTRPGVDERPFLMWKFRTMRNPKVGEVLLDRDRLTKIGRILRSTSVDELPQFANVLRGEMSLIGPRPLLLEYLPYFTENERLRFTMRPGIAGLAQVSGRNELGWDGRLACDVWYVNNWSLGLDWRIARLTVATIIRRRGFSDDPESLMENFDVERRRRLG